MQQVKQHEVNKRLAWLFFVAVALSTGRSFAQTDSSIRNQLTAPQSANFWINGRGLIGASSDLHPTHNLQVHGRTWLDDLAHFNWGAEYVNRSLTVDGSTMGYNDPLIVRGNDDYAAVIRSNGADRWDASYDAYETNLGVPNPSSSLVFAYGASGIPYYRRYGHDFTIFKVWSSTSSRNAYESTIALVNGDNEEEYVDFFNLSYPSSLKFGMRMQKRGTGGYKPFVFEYSDGITTYPVAQISPDTTAYFYGKVGIGTTDTKGYNLAVAGSIITGSIKVKQPVAWPDYVFKRTYKLRPLSEVAAFIKNNDHLPDVPSSKEVEEKGINIGETQALLLKKIEKLTLYMIELKAENQQQQKEIDRLKRQHK